MIMTTMNYPFGIDPAGYAPDRNKPIHLNVEGVGSMNFENSAGSIAQMAAMITAMQTGKELIVSDTQNFLTVTAWDPMKRILAVKLN